MGQYVYIDHIAVLLSYIQRVWVFVFGVSVASVLAGTHCSGTWVGLQCVISVCDIYSTVGVSRGWGLEGIGSRGDRRKTQVPLLFLHPFGYLVTYSCEVRRLLVTRPLMRMRILNCVLQFGLQCPEKA